MQQEARLPLWFLFANMLMVAGAFAVGAWLGRMTELPDPQATALQLVFREVRDNYVEPVDMKERLDEAIGALAEVDDWSAYVAPGDVPRFVEATSGTYEGIGVLVHSEEQRLFVQFPFAGGPAERAGLRPGDEIVAIDGTPLSELTPAEFAQADQRVRGPAGTTVELTLHRDGQQVVVAVQRAPVHKGSVRWAQLLDVQGRIGYAHVADFFPGATEELLASVERLRNGSSELRGLILDLRFDGGGSLDECVAMARLFVREGPIVTVKRRDKELVHTAEPGRAVLAALPLVLLVNGDTASASEVLTGALQDHGRAAVVGTRTFGKGLVQTVYTWEDFDFRLKLTTARYLTPDGRGIGPLQRPADEHEPCGLEPDVVVPVDPELHQQLRRALDSYEVPARHRAALVEFAGRHGLEVPAIVAPEQDPQLAAALAALRERIARGSGR